MWYNQCRRELRNATILVCTLVQHARLLSAEKLVALKMISYCHIEGKGKAALEAGNYFSIAAALECRYFGAYSISRCSVLGTGEAQ